MKTESKRDLSDICLFFFVSVLSHCSWELGKIPRKVMTHQRFNKMSEILKLTSPNR